MPWLYLCMTFIWVLLMNQAIINRCIHYAETSFLPYEKVTMIIHWRKILYHKDMYFLSFRVSWELSNLQQVLLFLLQYISQIQKFKAKLNYAAIQNWRCVIFYSFCWSRIGFKEMLHQNAHNHEMMAHAMRYCNLWL